MENLTFKATSITHYDDQYAIQVVDRTIDARLKPDEMLIKVAYAGMNKADLFLFLGQPKAIKLVYGLKRPKFPFVGSDIAGEVVACGSDVSEYKKGDKVFGDLSVEAFGGYAQYAKVNQKSIYHAPRNIELIEAAGLPMSASTSMVAIDMVKPKVEDHVLVYGASGAVGYTLAQLLIHDGYKVTLVASSKHHHYLTKLKPFALMDYENPNFKLEKNTYDAIFAVNGYQPIKTYMMSLKKKGKLAVIGGDFRQLNVVMFKGLFYRIIHGKKAMSVMSKSSPKTLKHIKEKVEIGHLNQIIGKIYPLENIREAYIDFKSGRHVGKIIIDMNA